MTESVHARIAGRVFDAPIDVSTYGSGFTAGTETFRYWKVGPVVTVLGQFQWTGGAQVTGTYTVATLPAGYCPPAGSEPRFIAWRNNTGTTHRVTIESDGDIRLDDALPTNHTWELFAQFPTV